MGKELRAYEATLAAIVLFGNAGLMIPCRGAKSGEFTAMTAAFVLSAVLYVLCFKAMSVYKTRNINKTLIYVVGTVLIFLCLYVCLETSKNFIEFVSNDVLIKNRKIYGAVAFFGVCIYAVRKPPVAITKFSAAALAFALITVGVLFILSFDNFDNDYLRSLIVGKVGNIAKRTSKYLAIYVLSPVVFSVFAAFYFKKPSLKTELFGFLAGAVLLGLCFLSAVLTFSLPVASDMNHAYSLSVSVVSVGELFTRMEAVAYFMFFFSALIKVAVCGFSVKAILFSMNIRKNKAAACLLVGAAVAISYIL